MHYFYICNVYIIIISVCVYICSIFSDLKIIILNEDPMNSRETRVHSFPTHKEN
jgi:hypothetical protein